jgi:hypothetical protein
MSGAWLHSGVHAGLKWASGQPYHERAMVRWLPALALGTLVGVMVALAVPPAAAEAQARAQGKLGVRAVHDARRSLARYDLTGDETTGMITSLAEVIERVKRPADRREARFLRAMAAADLVIIAACLNDPGLRDRVARAWGVDAAGLTAQLQRELEALQVGVYTDAASDALDALRILHVESGADPSWADLASLRSPEALRSRVLFTAAVRRALMDASEDPVAALAPMGTDPCAAEDDPDCTKDLLRFDAPGRRAIGVLRSAWRALDLLAQARTQGDPFPAAMAPVLRKDRQALRDTVLSPGPRLVGEAAAGLARAPDGARALSADVLVVVRQGEVQYGFVPKAKLGDQGEITVLAAGQPVLPDMSRHAIPRDFRPAVQPIDAVSDALGPAQGLRAALATADDVPGHVLARVIHSVGRASIRPVMLVGPSGEDGIRGARLRVGDTREGADGSPEVSVLVRLGGYTVRTRRGKTDVPRVRGADGLRFDVKGLGQQVGEQPPNGAAVEFMTVVTMDPVAQAVFRVAPAQAPVQLLIP